MDKPKTTPKDFFLWAGAMLALYVGVFNYIALVWDYINYSIPDPLDYYPADPYQSGISWEMASLIVIVPAFLILMWLIRRSIVNDSTRREVWVRHWALYLTLFAAGVAIVGDLIWVLYAFLNGTDLTTRFLLKALIVLFVASIGFMHFIADLWGYWEKFPTRNRLVAIATGGLVVLTVIAGFFIVGTPAQARLYRFDEQKITDLQNIQYQITSYYQLKQKLPQTLSELNNPVSDVVIPVDSQSKQAYEYQVVKAPYSFEICATFNKESRVGAQNVTMPEPMRAGYGKGATENWKHDAGRVCFERTIDPTLYPAIPPAVKNVQ